MKKYIVLLMIFGLFLGGASKVGAVSVKDLQNQIQILSSQINSLQDNLSSALIKAKTTVSQKILYRGSSGEEVMAIQEALKDRGFLKDKIDGKFGPKTMEAVLTFQKQNGLTGNGIVDEETSNLILNSSDSSDNLFTINNTNINPNLPLGCISPVGYSPTTGLSCGCNETVYSTYNGQLCPSNLPPGCFSPVGYSPTTGLSCGCNGTVYSTYNGQLCPA